MGSGGACALYPATYPERVQSLILVNFRQSYPELRGSRLSHRQASRDAASESVERLQFENPRAAHDPVAAPMVGSCHAARDSPSRWRLYSVRRCNGDVGPLPFDVAYPDAGVAPPR